MRTVTLYKTDTGQTTTCDISQIVNALTTWWETHTPDDARLVESAANLQCAVAVNKPTDKYEEQLGVEIVA